MTIHPAAAHATPRLTRAERLGILGIWSALGLLESLKAWVESGLEERPVSLATALVGNMPWWLVWAAFTPAVIALARRARLERDGLAGALPLHLAASVGFSVLHHLVVGVLYYLTHTRGLELYGPSGAVAMSAGLQVRRFFGAYFVLNVLSYWAIVGAYLGLEFYKRYREGEVRALRLESAMHEARLEALRMELNPHFLFNALNAVAGLVRGRQNDQAVRMLSRLSQLLRSTLEEARDPEVPLEKELRLLEIYLEIERVRFGERLTVRIDAGPPALPALVPPLILQPLVENAVRHGVARHEGPALLEVRAWVEGERLRISVLNSGGDASAPVPSYGGGGIGLENTRERLAHFYGDSATLELRPRPQGGTVVELDVPLRVEDAGAGGDLAPAGTPGRGERATRSERGAGHAH